MTAEIRPLAAPEFAAAWQMSRLAFGGGDRQPPDGALGERPGRQSWGAFDSAGRLVAKAVDREQGHWFGGRLVPASGVAGVAVAPELRGTGLARRVLTALLGAARQRGAMISTLFPTVPDPYRRLGYEEVGALVWTALPTADLARAARPPEVRPRTAEQADVPALLEIYRTVARLGAGLLERSGPLFDTTAHGVLAGHDGITVAESGAGEIEGFASWDRGPGYDVAAWLSVPDLLGLTARATTALLATLGTWAPVAPALRLRLPDPDPATKLASFAGASVHSRDPWMLRVIDASAAVSARGWPMQLQGSIDLLVEDEVCPWNAGPHRLSLSGGHGTLTPGGSGAVRLTARGLALLFAGGTDPSLLRRAGLMAGPSHDDGFLQVLSAGPSPALLDYF